MNSWANFLSQVPSSHPGPWYPVFLKLQACQVVWKQVINLILYTLGRMDISKDSTRTAWRSGSISVPPYPIYKGQITPSSFRLHSSMQNPCCEAYVGGREWVWYDQSLVWFRLNICMLRNPKQLYFQSSTDGIKPSPMPRIEGKHSWKEFYGLVIEWGFSYRYRIWSNTPLGVWSSACIKGEDEKPLLTAWKFPQTLTAISSSSSSSS